MSMQSLQRTTGERERDSERERRTFATTARIRSSSFLREILFVMKRFEEKNSKMACVSFRVLNPIEAQKMQGKYFWKSLSLLTFFYSLKYLFFTPWRRDIKYDGASKRPRPRGRTIRKNVRDGRQSEADEREGWENVGVILRVRENGEEDDVDDEDPTNWNDVDGAPFE